MALDRIADKVIETDVMIMGGGIAGCYAAAKAAQRGLHVTLVEKSKTDRSGNAAMGIDHYGEVENDGITPLQFVKLDEERSHDLNGDGRFTDPNLIYQYLDQSRWALEESEKLGITMRWDDGEFYFIPQPWHGGPRLNLRVHWQDIKPKLAKAVRKSGANVLERTGAVCRHGHALERIGGPPRLHERDLGGEIVTEIRAPIAHLLERSQHLVG